MEEINNRLFLTSEKCSSCRSDGFALCITISETEKYYICLTCILEIFNNYNNGSAASEESS
jgi:hypothetical protein